MLSKQHHKATANRSLVNPVILRRWLQKAKPNPQHKTNKPPQHPITSQTAIAIAKEASQGTPIQVIGCTPVIQNKAVAWKQKPQTKLKIAAFLTWALDTNSHRGNRAIQLNTHQFKGSGDKPIIMPLTAATINCWRLRVL